MAKTVVRVLSAECRTFSSVCLCSGEVVVNDELVEHMVLSQLGKRVML